MIRLCTVLVLSVFHLALVAEEEVPLSDKAQEVIKSYESEVSKELAKVQKEVSKLRADAIEDLEKELKSQTRKGNLKVSIAIQKKIDQLKESAPVTDVFGADAVEAKNKFSIVGSWLCESDGYYEIRIFNKDKSFKCYQSNAEAKAIRELWSTTYTVGDTGLIEVVHMRRKHGTELHSITSDGELAIKGKKRSYKGKRLKQHYK